MKSVFLSLVAVLMTAGVAAAQDLSGNANSSVAGTRAGTDVTGFRTPSNVGPSQSSKFPNAHPNLAPRAGGIFVDGVRNGTQMINPAAPASFGYGEKYLSAPSSRYDLERESGPAAHRDTGGFKLLSWEF